jgi:SAM-dependent methyltransferase
MPIAMDEGAPNGTSSATILGSSADSMVHRVPAVGVVDRVDYLVRQSRGKRVVHLAFVDAGRMERKLEQGQWLHEALADSARELIGIDVDEDGVRLARKLGFEAHVGDCQSVESIGALDLAPADMVLAGELIEHLDCPGVFLEAVKPLLVPGGTLVLTTPNASGLTNFAAALLRREVVNPDHVSWYSWRTLLTLLERHRWTVRDFLYYRGASIASRDQPTTARLRTQAFNAFRAGARPLLALWPSLAEGMVVRCTTAKSAGDED